MTQNFRIRAQSAAIVASISAIGLMFMHEAYLDEAYLDEAYLDEAYLDEEYLGEESFRTTTETRIHERRRTARAARTAAGSLLTTASDVEFEHLFRMPKSAFRLLVAWARNGGHLRDSHDQTVEQKLMVFIWILAFHEPQRHAARKFGITQSRVSTIFQQCLTAMLHLHKQHVRQPDANSLSPQRELDPRLCQFDGCIGAIGSTHIAAHIEEAQRRCWHNREGLVSQNVFAAVNFDYSFAYVLAGAEGSMDNADLLGQATARSFRVPERRYYLAGAGFGLNAGIITPWSRQRFHRNDSEASGSLPATDKELYNLRHARLRSIVEKVFEMLKKKWRILCNEPVEYSIKDQLKIVYAVTGLHNFLLSLARPQEELSAAQKLVVTNAQARANQHLTGRSGVWIRRTVTKWNWEAYQADTQAQQATN